MSALLISCAGEAPILVSPPPKPAQAPVKPAVPCVIDGTVVSASGEPIEGALVALVDTAGAGFNEEGTRAAAKTTSLAGGAFHLEGVKAGKYALTATSPRAPAAYLGDLEVTEAKPLTGVTLTMSKEGATLSGVVRSDKGIPMPRAEVRAVRVSEVLGDIFYTTTDDAGHYTVRLPKASYGVGAVAPAFELVPQQVRVADDAKLDLQLEPKMDLSPPPAVVVDWMKSHAIPIARPDAGHGLDDLAPLEKVIGKARVVSLGEATHGTREFFQLKHRMLEMLVTRMDFNVFGIEATMPEGFDVNDYVLTGKGDPEKALGGLYFWTWDTEEVLDLIRWMRAWNADPKHKKKVKFYGVDMQSPERAAKVLRAYLHKVDPTFEETARALLIRASLPATKMADRSPERAMQLLATLKPIMSAFEERRAAWEKRSSAAEWALAKQHATILAQCMQMDASPDNPSVRDLAMAENVRWVLDHEGPASKMVLWAHNAHIGKIPYVGGIQSMGSVLKKALKDQLFTIGFAFDRGGFQAVEMATGAGVRDFNVPSLAMGDVGSALSLAGAPLAAFDFRSLPADGPVHDWWTARHPMREMGAAYNEQAPMSFVDAVVLPERFDALLFVQQTTPARPNGGRRKRETLPSPANLNFQEGDKGKGPPAGWTAPTATRFGYTIETVDGAAKRGKKSLSIHRTPGHYYGEAPAIITQRVDAAPFVGKHVTITAVVKAKLLSDTSAARLLVDVTPSASKDPWPTNVEILSKDWANVSISIDVPAGTKSLSYGLSFSGDGELVADVFSVEAH
jgi:erythromycin esterase